MGKVVREGLTQAGGRSIVELGRDSNLPWHEITVSIFDASGDPATGVTGTLAGEVRKKGADQFEDFTADLNLAGDDRSWNAESSIVDEFAFTPTGLNATYTYTVTINSWGVE